MRKILFIAGALLLLAAACNSATIGGTSSGNPVAQNPEDSKVTSSPDSNTNTKPTPPQDGKNITITGNIVCLPPKGSNGFTNEMCAIGLMDSANKYYGLSNLPISITTGQKVTIVGLITPSNDQKYNTSSNIYVISSTVVK